MCLLFSEMHNQIEFGHVNSRVSQNTHFDNLTVCCINVDNVIYGGSLINFLPDTDGPLAAGCSEDIHHGAQPSSAAIYQPRKNSFAAAFNSVKLDRAHPAPSLRPPRIS